MPLEIRLPVAARVFTLVFLTCWCAGLLWAAISTESVLPGLMAIFGVAIGWWNLRMLVRVDGDGLMVRNGLRARRFAWDEVEGFRAGRLPGVLPFGRMLHVLLRDGSIVQLDVTARLALTKRGVDQVDSWLNDLCGWSGSAGRP